ncbi:hypothetical protein KCP78_13985 [Salmonella enterica subsp. enterica]|nr:hypothetical protein KCP78_13985 [Salmonella enterica subsp. enterica]
MVDDDRHQCISGAVVGFCVMAAGVVILSAFMALTRCFFLYTGPFSARANAGIGDYRHCAHLLVKGKILLASCLLPIGRRRAVRRVIHMYY